MKTYAKPALTVEQQLELLEKRGLVIFDHNRAVRHLSNISYYRLSAYMLPFRVRNMSGGYLDEFVPGTSWDDVFNLYKFDRKLRLLVFDSIERIEIALRAQVIYQLSHKYGPHWQDDCRIFRVPGFNKRTGKVYDVFQDIQKHINEQLHVNQKATFIEHYLKTYDKPPTPPCWMSVELLYFSELSKICQNLNIRKDRTDISGYFGVKDDSIFCSWLHSLNYIRNICAHHSRLWNIVVDITPMKYVNKDSSKIWLTNFEVQNIQRSKL